MVGGLDPSKATFAIFSGGEVVHKLDGKFLPDGTPYVGGSGTRTTVLPETTLENVTSPIEVSRAITFIEGATYYVTWNGVKYTCFAHVDKNGSIAPGLGNGVIAIPNYYENTGEPFFIMGIEGNLAIFYNDSSTTVVVSIEKSDEVFHKIDEKCLPDSLLTKDAVDSELSPTSTNLVQNKVINAALENKLNKTNPVVEGSLVAGASTASGILSVAYGASCKAHGNYSAAFGSNSKTTGHYSFAAGEMSTCSGQSSVAFGMSSTASGQGAFAMGHETAANGWYSCAFGQGTIATKSTCFVSGSYNVEDTEKCYLHIVGNGGSLQRRNAYTLDKNGNGWFSGTVEATALILSSPNGTRFKITVDDNGTLSATAVT